MNTKTRTDSELLHQISGDKATSEAAFRQLVDRYSPLVINVCARCLWDESEVEDAAQATFLVLWRKANRLTRYECVAGWLHRVARNICRNLNRSQQARRERETKKVKMKQEASTEKNWNAIRDLLDGELDRIPEKYRLPLILRYLEGHDANRVAELLGVNASTVRTRLSRGRDMLRARLTKRGISISVAPLTAAVAANARAAQVPHEFANATSTIATSTVPPTINLLATGVIQAMTYKTATVSACVVLAILASLGGIYATGSLLGESSIVTQLPWSGPSISPAVFADGRGVIVPLTSELQRLATVKLRDADAVMIVDGASCFPGIDKPSQKDVDEFDYSNLSDELGEVLAGADASVLVVRVIWPSVNDKSLIAAQSFQAHLVQAIQPFCKDVRLGSVLMSAGVENDKWSSDVITMVKPPTRAELRSERRVGDSQVGVYAVHTPLSRYLYRNVDCVVHIVPLLEDATLDMIDVMQSSVDQLELPRKVEVAFLCHWKDSAAFARHETLVGEQVWRDRLGFEKGGIQIQPR